MCARFIFTITVASVDQFLPRVDRYYVERSIVVASCPSVRPSVRPSV